MHIRIDVKTLSDYLQSEVDEGSNVPDTVLLKHATVLDIVRPESTVSCCFTSGYYRWVDTTACH